MSDKARVLVVEDDPDIGDVVRRSLRREGYDVRLASDGSEALDEAAVFEPDAVVLDLGLPKVDGIEVSRRLRADGDVPILMLTARDSVDARVQGLDSGADDYLVKPFDLQELLARVRALLRRRPPRGSASLIVGDLRLNPATHEAARGVADDNARWSFSRPAEVKLERGYASAFDSKLVRARATFSDLPAGPVRITVCGER